MKRLADKVALITGGAAGIGLETARLFLSEGAKVALVDLRESDLSDGNSGDVLTIAADVSSVEDCERYVAQTVEKFGRIDVFFNNAGIEGKVAPLIDQKIKDFDRVMAVNVTGSLLCAQRAGRAMLRQGYGRIVNIASVSGIRAGVGRTAYGTPKAAMIGLTRQIALELAPHGVTANAVAPGAIVTPLTQAFYTKETVASILSMVPNRRMGETSDIAAAVSYLASRDAGYVNGEVLVVDGGFVAAGMTQTGRLHLGASDA